MKRFLFVFALLMTACMVASAQGRNKVSGSVVEFESNEAVTGATVRLLSLPDSALVVGTTTDVEGKFLLNNVRRGTYVLVVSFIGYVTKEKMVDLSNRRSGTLDAGRIVIVENSELLEGVEVTAMASKVQVSGDSLMFNASAYPVPEGSTLEALIMMLPGAKVDEDGNITINGQTV
ncbi:MAG: carboxypeptidase-like regulatory domain-containing protein, partial [Bacteroidaceae bacterium]|nr:carboxypeptidase-like regulatory domain-containing protein [Bacteroidaceae bacterium]